MRWLLVGEQKRSKDAEVGHPIDDGRRVRELVIGWHDQDRHAGAWKRGETVVGRVSERATVPDDRLSR